MNERLRIPRRYPAARWRGPVPNERPGGMVLPLMGLVVHVEQGTEAGTDVWFHNPDAQVSAHFGGPKVDAMGQLVPIDEWVEIGDRAWAEAAGNQRWLSYEGEGHADEPMDTGQLSELAQLYAWLHNEIAVSWFPFRTSHSPTEHGLGTHAMGGDAWGAHPGCPGSKRTAQLPFVIAKAITMVHPHPAHVPTSPHPVTPAYPGHPLTTGAHGAAVLALQQHLRARGWAIAADGIYGPATRRAVADFQAEKHLRVDGATGPVTWWAIWHLPVT
jgi:hypothetical protein